MQEKAEKIYQVPEKMMVQVIQILQQLPYQQVAPVMRNLTTLVAEQNKPQKPVVMGDPAGPDLAAQAIEGKLGKPKEQGD